MIASFSGLAQNTQSLHCSLSKTGQQCANFWGLISAVIATDMFGPLFNIPTLCDVGVKMIKCLKNFLQQKLGTLPVSSISINK